MRRIAFLFPGQGAQVVGMGLDFYKAYPESREVFDLGEKILGRSILETIFHGPQDVLTQTRNSQPAIFLTSMAVLAALKKEIPHLNPTFVAGLSLGEYSALCSAGVLTFHEILPLVQYRADAMNDACEKEHGEMAAVIGLSAEQVENFVEDLNMPNDLWVANYNCPGQCVISGTEKGVAAGEAAAKEAGAKLVKRLDVHGAFHSGLMMSAQELLGKKIQEASFKDSPVHVVMNRPGCVVQDLNEMRKELTEQVTSSVRWEQGIRSINEEVQLFIEIGCGKSLAGMNRKIGCTAPTICVSKVEEIEKAKEWLNGN
jgi:[acyl-carrier-protein] S-malonyltransferase